MIYHNCIWVYKAFKMDLQLYLYMRKKRSTKILQFDYKLDLIIFLNKTTATKYLLNF